MQYRIRLTKRAKDELKKLDLALSRRILKKLSYYQSQARPLLHAKKLVDAPVGTYRFRIGDYRAIFDIDAMGNITILVILTIKHRKEVYRC